MPRPPSSHSSPVPNPPTQAPLPPRSPPPVRPTSPAPKSIEPAPVSSPGTKCNNLSDAAAPETAESDKTRRNLFQDLEEVSRNKVSSFSSLKYL